MHKKVKEFIHLKRKLVVLEYVIAIDLKVILIDGNKQTGYMIDFNLGAAISTIFEINSDDFDEED